MRTCLNTKFVAFAFALGLMVSPDSLALLGQTGGKAGMLFPALIVAAASLYLLHAGGYRALFGSLPHPAGEIVLIKNVLGPLPIFFPFVSRAVAAVVMATGLLVSSGFVFNEVFVYWFPNFGFAFMLLTLLSILHLLKPTVAETAQLFFVGAAVLGLMILSIAGAASAIGGGTLVIPSGVHLGLHTAFTPLLLFIGFDLAVLSTRQPIEERAPLFRAIQGAIVSAAAVFSLWGLVSLMHVSAGRLGGTSIPHITAAREILGQPGRLLMGVVVIAGSCAAVNALYTAVSRMISEMATHRLIPRFAGRPSITVMCLAFATALMMGTGMAGEERLETFIRAALLLWLFGYGMLHLALILKKTKENGKPIKTGNWLKKTGPWAALVMTLSGGVILSVNDPHRVLLVKFMAGVAGSSLALGLIGRMLRASGSMSTVRG